MASQVPFDMKAAASGVLDQTDCNARRKFQISHAQLTVLIHSLSCNPRTESATTTDPNAV